MITYEHQHGRHTITFFYPDLHRNWHPVVLEPTSARGQREIAPPILEWLQINATMAWMPVYTSEYLIEPDSAGSHFGGSAANWDFKLILFRSKADAALFKLFCLD